MSVIFGNVYFSQKKTKCK